MGKFNSYSSMSGTSQRRSKSKDISWYRAQWSALIEENPGSSTFALRRRAAGIYSWLSRHDREWLMVHCPAKKLTRKQRSQVQLFSQTLQEKLLSKDEMTLDAQTAEAVWSAANKLITTLDPPERITLRRLSREVPLVSRLKLQPDQAPLTVQAVQEVIETSETFALRRLRQTAQQYREDWVSPTRAAFIQRAKLRSSLRFPRVRQAFREAMISLLEFAD